jgi:hypothetical protein
MEKEITKLESDMYEAMIHETNMDKCASLAAEVSIKYHQSELKNIGVLADVREPFLKWGDAMIGFIAGLFMTIVILGLIFNAL